MTRTYLVERYWPGIDEVQLRGLLPALDREASAMREEGKAVAHVGSILMPADQVVFTLIAAVSEAAVRELNERVHMPIDRVAEAIQLLPDQVLEVRK
jgi:hypothetical protein